MKNKLLIFLSFSTVLAAIFISGLLKYCLVFTLTFIVTSFSNFRINIPKNTRHIIFIYLFYVFFEFISLITENVTNDNIFAKIMPRHLIVILLIINLSTLNRGNFNKVMHLFFILTLASCLLSILQFLQFKPALDLYNILYPYNSSYESFNLESIAEKNYAFYGYPGLYENIVLSSQYSSSFLIFSFYFFKKKKILSSFISLIFIVALFLMQVRSGLYSSLLVLIVFAFIYYRKYFMFIFIPFLIYFISVFNSILDSINLRVLDSSSPIRDVVNQNFWSYVNEGNILGKREYFSGRNLFLKQQNIETPHHILKNSYVLAGIPGFFVTIIILFKTTFFNLKKAFSYKHHYIFKASIFCYLVSAFTHNNCFLFGDPLMFVLFLFNEKN